MNGLKTYDDWIREGRTVLKGERAGHYIVSPCGTQHRALFHESQTVELASPHLDWTTVVPADELPRPEKDRRPVVRIKFDGTTVAVWCGPNKEAIRLFQKNQYAWDRHTRRWTARRNDVEKLAAGLEQHGFRVIREDLVAAVAA
jgi:hypothetical protein